MLKIHPILDRIFHKKVTFSIFFRIWFSFAWVVIFASTLSIYQLQKNIRPSAKRVVEDTLVDTSRLLAVMLVQPLQTGEIYQPQFQQNFANAFNQNNQQNLPTWFHQKTSSQFHIYITDKHGIVIYDSQNKAMGKDFSRWNDIYLTLQGKYGARSSRINDNDNESSVMYVASPIINNQQQLIGVVSVGKPVNTLLPYIHASRYEIIKTILYITLLGLLVSALMAWWLRHSIQTVNRYTQNIIHTYPPHFYLGKELNQLVSTIDDMKNTIENRAYVTEYVHTLTHELKSPLTAIKASAELLGENLPANDREQFSQTILHQSDKLQQLVEQMLILSKIEQPTFKLNQHNHEILPIIENCIYQQQAWIKSKLLSYQLFSDSQPTCFIDSFWLQQALQNLIDNAIKFADICFFIHIYQRDNQWVIDFINDSETLPDYVLEKAFLRYFSQQTQTKNTQQKGTGLGLTLVKQVIEHHQGLAGIQQKRFSELQVADNIRHWLQTIIKNKQQNFVIVTITLPC